MSPQPRICVVLPVDQPAAPALESLAAQDLARDRFQVVAVAPASAREAVQAWLAGSGLAHQLVEAPEGADPRNAGLDEAAADHVMLLDAQDRITPNALSALDAAADSYRLPLLVTDEEAEELEQRPANELALYKLPRLAARVRGKLYPSDMLSGHRFQDTSAGSEAVLSARIHERFATQYVQVDLAATRAGARIVPGVQRFDDDYQGVRQRMTALASLLSGRQARPEERSPVTDAVVTVLVEQVEAHLAAHPADRDRLRDEGLVVPGIDIALGGGHRWPGYGVAVGLDQPQHPVQAVSLVSESTRQILKRGDRIGLVRGAGIQVRAAYLSGSFDAKKLPFPHHRFTIVATAEEGAKASGTSLQAKLSRRARRLEKTARKLARRAAPRVIPGQALPRVVRATDPAAVDFLADSVVLGLSPTGRSLARGLGVEPQDHAVLDALTLSAASVRGVILNKHSNSIRLAARAVARQGADWEFMPPTPVWAMTSWRLYKSGRTAGAQEVLETGRSIHGDAHSAAVFDVLGLLLHVGAEFTLPDGWQDVVRAAMTQADEALEAGDLAEAVFLTNLVCEALFHGDLNANAENPPVVRDPAGLLEPLRSSRVWQLLTSPQTEQGSTAPAALAAERPGMLLIPGAYPRFSKGVVAALQEAGEVEVVNLQDYASPFGNTGVGPQWILARLQHALGQSVGQVEELFDIFQGRDAVFADWADKGAMLATLATPPGTRLVVRMHGVDALSLWPHLMDWTRVDDVIFVSEHLGRVFNQVMGSRLDGVQQHVIGNFVDVDRFAAESTEDAHLTLGMVGYAQKVKDALYAVDILARLRKVDPAYRLKLIGADFPVRQARQAEDQYAKAFRQRILADDVVDAIDFVGYSTDLPRHLRGVGFALSTSLRESWPVGPTEMVAAQAVPLYRDWPVFRDVGGPRLIFGDWVFDTPQEAVERILALRDREDWLAAANQARELVRERFSPRETGSLYRRIVTGRDDAPAAEDQDAAQES